MVTIVASQKRKKPKKSMSGIGNLWFAERTLQIIGWPTLWLLGGAAAKSGKQVAFLRLLVIRNGGLKVVAHPHAQVSQQISADLIELQLLENLPRAAEAAAGHIAFGFYRRHGHQSDKLQIGHRVH